MFLKKSLFVMLLATFILAAACGGAEKSHDAMAEPDPMSDTEPKTEPAAESEDDPGVVEGRW